MTSRSNNCWYRFSVQAVLLSIVWVNPVTSSGQSKQKPPVPASQNPRRTLDDFLDPANGPITLTKLLELLQQVRDDIEPEGRILRAVDARSVDFPMTPANVQKISTAGGSAKLMELLQRKAPLPPVEAPPPEKKKEEPKGVLKVRCEPRECEIIVQGGPPVVGTKEGTASLTLPAGEATVDVRKAGYVGQRHPVRVNTGSDNQLSVTLEPDDNTQAEFGDRLFKAMVKAAGGESIHKDFAVFSATGSATLFDAAGVGTEWNLTVTFRSGQATLEARNSAGGLKLECRGETCQAQSTGKFLAKRLSKEQAQLLETNLRQFRAYHFAALLEHLNSASMQATAKTAFIPPAGEQHLRLDGTSEVYNISLDAQLLPSLLTFESKTGIGSGLTLGFADYELVGASHYPRTTEIKLPNGKQGLRVRFDNFGSQTGAK